MPAEVLRFGLPAPGQRWIDGTAGGGGHSRLIANAVGHDGRVLCIDRDPAAVSRLNESLPDNCVCEVASYDLAQQVLARLGWDAANGILLDLGLSSDQLADSDRGFSFQATGDLDMRFDPTQGQPAWEWLKYADEKTIADAIYRYGEERFSRRIARRIVEFRRTEPLRTADQLRQIVAKSVPRGGSPPSKARKRSSSAFRKPRSLDPATRTFQALRIVVNDELAILEKALSSLVECLVPGGVLLVISFHSLEDRIVKHAMRNDHRLDVETKKPVQPGEAEVASNPRARSAKMRVARRRLAYMSADST